MSGILVLILRLFLSLALLGFLGYALYILWRDLKFHTQMVSPKLPPALLVRVHLEGNVFDAEITNPTTIGGRDSACDLHLPHDTVSARHIRFSHHHGQWWVEDLQSTNGTMLNEERIYVPTVITNGDEILCGEVAIQILGSKKTTDI